MISTKEKFEVIQKLKNEFPVLALCKIACVSRSGYYKWLKRSKDKKDCGLKDKITYIYENSKKVYGYRRIKAALERDFKININHKKIRRLMKDLNIKSVIRRKKFKYINPKNMDIQNVEPNVLNRNFNTDKLDQKWVTDITYLYYGKDNSKAYLSALMDLHNNEIVAYRLSTSLDITFVEDMLKDAFSKEKGHDLSNLIIHSDQGCHYKSRSYKKILQTNTITQSMSRKGNCYDNACIESFFSHLKTELIYQHYYSSKEELFNSIDEYIEWYNKYRIQSILNNRTPFEVRCAA